MQYIKHERRRFDGGETTYTLLKKPNGEYLISEMDRFDHGNFAGPIYTHIRSVSSQADAVSEFEAHIPNDFDES